MIDKELLPDILEFEIGGYEADSYKIDWVSNYLTYASGRSHLYLEKQEVTPTEEQWKQFWEMMNDINVWEWKGDYSAIVMDGTSWSLKIKHGSMLIDTSGHMAWPDPDNLSKAVELEVTALELLQKNGQLVKPDHAASSCCWVK